MTDAPSKPVLVTGASGFLGSCVVRRMVEVGVPVRCLVRAASRRDRLAGLPVDFKTGDVLDADTIERAVGGCDSVIHLAGPSAWKDLDAPWVEPVIVEGARNVLSAAAGQGVRRIVHVSTAAVLGPSRLIVPRDESSPETPVDRRAMPYVAAKRDAERLCRRAVDDGLDVVVVNPCEVFGPDDRDLVTAGSLLSLARGPVAWVCRGGTAIAHVDDVADAIVCAWRHGRTGERYFLGGDNVSHTELARLVDEARGRRRPVVSVPNALVRGAARLADRLKAPFPVPQAVVPYATAYWHLDTTKARQELGARFRTARETVADTVAWLRSSGRLP